MSRYRPLVALVRYTQDTVYISLDVPKPLDPSIPLDYKKDHSHLYTVITSIISIQVSVPRLLVHE